ncbi:vasculin-like [Centruroides vittatus]|uniref:vasculin-like n=1 Tax=Centruroides vittatus TaxID=120091 RepID=UPI00351014D8
MANNNAPAHDFAPAWLKIPTYENFLTGADSERGGHTSRKDDHRGYGRRSRETDSLTPKQQYFPDTRRERDSFSGERKPYFPSRHHSIDFDESQGPGNCTRLFNSSYNNSSLSNSQPSLLRRPHSRHDFRDIPSYTKIGVSQTLYEKAKGKEGAINISSNCPEIRGMDVTSNTFNQEFPSLQGDGSIDSTFQPPVVNGGAWEKPRNAKVHCSQIGKKIQLVKRGSKQDNGIDIRSKSPSGSCLQSQCGSPKVNTHPVIIAPVNKNSINSSVNSSVYRTLVPSKKMSHSVMSNMEILVKNPKAPGNKSDFLKALRTETGSKGDDAKEGNKEIEIVSPERNKQNQGENGNEIDDKEEHVNSINIEKLSLNQDTNETALSSSLEAEQRLLREMGWKEEGSDDDDTYAPLTEDELREFRDLSQKIAEKRNGIQKNLQMTLSPKRLPPPYLAVGPRIDNWSDFSETDSDSD